MVRICGNASEDQRGQSTVAEKSMDSAAKAPGLKSQFCPLLANDLGQMTLPICAPISSSVK